MEVLQKKFPGPSGRRGKRGKCTRDIEQYQCYVNTGWYQFRWTECMSFLCDRKVLEHSETRQEIFPPLHWNL